MKGHFLFFRIVLVSLILAPAWASAEDVLPKISLERTVCDLGQVGLGSKNSCEFKFTNTGQGPLKISNVKSTCGCTVAQLEKKEYAPGQSGTIKVTYTAPNTTTTTQKSIYVSSNDKANPNIRLTIKAEVVQIIQALPAKLNLSLREKDLGINEITLQSLDNQPFSIKSFASTNCNCITADTDPNISASKFVLHPMADIEKLKVSPNGLIEIQLTHPQCRSFAIPYELLPEFKATPAQINISSAKPGEAITREITVASNYGEAFEIVSTSSKNGLITLLSREKVADANAFKLRLQISPPLGDSRSFFTDALDIGIRGKDTLSVACRGFYASTAASKPGKAAKKELPGFKTEPQVVKVLNTEPGTPVTAEVLVSGSKGECFQVESATSQKGIVELVGRKEVENGYKLELKIMPPPSEHRLEVFSDVLYVSVRGEDGSEATKLPIPCRGTYSRPRR